MEARFKVRQDLAYWASSCGTFAPGETHVVNGTAEDMQTIADAFSAGTLVEVEWDDEAKDAWSYEPGVSLAEAMESGEWQKGHLAQFGIDAENAGLIEIGDGG